MEAIIFFIALVSLPSFFAGLLIGYFVKHPFQHRLLVKKNKGEAAVRKIIVDNFNSEKFHLLNNITIPFQDGTTEIDHILVSTKGIFIIETKNYSGWIFGNENSKQWTQVIYRVKHKFQNPIYQNYKHVKALHYYLDFIPKEHIYPIVVFTERAEFKTPIPKGVIYISQLFNYLNSYQEDIISINRLQFCVGRLECKRYAITKQTDLQHHAYLAKKFNEN